MRPEFGGVVLWVQPGVRKVVAGSSLLFSFPDPPCRSAGASMPRPAVLHQHECPRFIPKKNMELPGLNTPLLRPAHSSFITAKPAFFYATPDVTAKSAHPRSPKLNHEHTSTQDTSHPSPSRATAAVHSSHTPAHMQQTSQSPHCASSTPPELGQNVLKVQGPMPRRYRDHGAPSSHLVPPSEPVTLGLIPAFT